VGGLQGAISFEADGNTGRTRDVAAGAYLEPDLGGLAGHPVGAMRFIGPGQYAGSPIWCASFRRRGKRQEQKIDLRKQPVVDYEDSDHRIDSWDLAAPKSESPDLAGRF
jgi:hypothetical protein